MEDKQTPLNSSSGRGKLGMGTVWLIFSFKKVGRDSSPTQNYRLTKTLMKNQWTSDRLRPPWNSRRFGHRICDKWRQPIPPPRNHIYPVNHCTCPKYGTICPNITVPSQTSIHLSQKQTKANYKVKWNPLTKLSDPKASPPMCGTSRIELATTHNGLNTAENCLDNQFPKLT